MVKERALTFRMSGELRDALELAARADQRQVASLIRKILTDWCREHGFLAPPGEDEIPF